MGNVGANADKSNEFYKQNYLGKLQREQNNSDEVIRKSFIGSYDLNSSLEIWFIV